MSNADDIALLREEVDRLRKENFELKKCIRLAISKIQDSNTQMKTTLTGGDPDIYKTNFKEANWLKKEDDE
jgi:hypothetical protein